MHARRDAFARTAEFAESWLSQLDAANAASIPRFSTDLQVSIVRIDLLWVWMLQTQLPFPCVGYWSVLCYR